MADYDDFFTPAEQDGAAHLRRLLAMELSEVRDAMASGRSECYPVDRRVRYEVRVVLGRAGYMTRELAPGGWFLGRLQWKPGHLSVRDWMCGWRLIT